MIIIVITVTQVKPKVSPEVGTEHQDLNSEIAKRGSICCLSTVISIIFHAGIHPM